MKVRSPLKRSAVRLRRTPLARQSARRRAEGPGRARCEAIVRERADGRCQARTPVCVGVGQHAHELLKRAQCGSYLDPDNCIWCCNHCNGWIEDHPREARKRGLVVLSWEAKQ